MIFGDTIAAIATAPGRGGVAVVRVSGSESFGIAERLTGKPPKAGRICLREIGVDRGIDTDIDHIDNRISQPTDAYRRLSTPIDTGLLLAFKSPHSYTGEDVVEFQCHGGTVTPRRVLAACLAAGARLARRGEFTERAFLNGRLDYAQAESVLDLIDAKTARAADAALEGLSGRRARECHALYESALDLSTHLEHALDIDEGELPVGFADELRVASCELRVKIEEAIRKAAESRLLKSGALVVLAGPPNAGKSSLLNALLDENRAIVSDVPGTTRDSIEAWIDLDGWPIRLVDTAGLREAKDEIEGEGVKRSEDLIAKADVVVFLGGCNVTGLQGSRSGMVRLCNSATLQPLLIHAKCDLGRGDGLNVSAKTGEGLDELKRAIVAKLEEKVASSDDGDVPEGDVTAYQEALALLNGGRETRDVRREEDLVLMANSVRAAAGRLGEAIGATYSSDMLDNLFSRFCVGK